MSNNAEKRKVDRNRLDPKVYEKLEGIVGSQWISDDRAIVEAYSRYTIDAEGFLKKHQKDGSNIPACVVLPHTTGEIQSIVRVLNRYRIAFVPFTNGQSFCGPTSPAPTVILHLSRMNRILDIDVDNMNMTIEPFVDYGQVQSEAMKYGLFNGGTPLASSLTKLASQFSTAGMWQTDLKYSGLTRNVLGLEMVLPDGEILRTGSSTIPNAGNFYECGPGPDLQGLLRLTLGTTGIVTKITIKLHSWVGDPVLKAPEDRPSMHDWSSPKYDNAEVPKNHRLLWVECPDIKSEMEIMYRTCHAGIGIGLNAFVGWIAMMCSQSLELSEKRYRERFFPSYHVYISMAATTADGQLDYEEKVFRHIVDQVGGCSILSTDYKPDVLEALSTLNLDFVRAIFGFRITRRAFTGIWFPLWQIDMATEHQELWQGALDDLGPIYDIAESGGTKSDTTPSIFCADRGHSAWTETDNFPEPLNPEQLLRSQAFMGWGAAAVAGKKLYGHLIGGTPAEPFTSFFPEIGPNMHLFLRKIRKVFDPNGVEAPGRMVFTEEELKHLPPELSAQFNAMRKMHGMKAV